MPRPLRDSRGQVIGERPDVAVVKPKPASVFAIRLALRAPGSDAVTASVWADVEVDDGVLVVALRHSYPDLQLATGWHFEHDGKRYKVGSVADGVANCFEVEN